MAAVTQLVRVKLERESKHSEVECTFDIIVDEQGRKWLQLDTYGSDQRQIKGKKSQSVRLSPSAIQQLKEIINEHQL